MQWWPSTIQKGGYWSAVDCVYLYCLQQGVKSLWILLVHMIWNTGSYMINFVLFNANLLNLNIDVNLLFPRELRIGLVARISWWPFIQQLYIEALDPSIELVLISSELSNLFSQRGTYKQRLFLDVCW